MKSIKEIDIVSSEPNFTIVLPTGCNADCSFCSWRTSNQDKQNFNTDRFLEGLTDTLEHLPPQCNQITISGGEPSTYKYLSKVMNIIEYHKRKNIKKVVFTTNGTNLLNLSREDWFTDVVDFVNISRHAYDQTENDNIFKIKTIDWKTIKSISKNLAVAGIPTNINCVLSDSISMDYDENFIKQYVKVAHKNFVNSITFRKDYDDGFGIHPIEKTMGKAKNIGECPVCRKSRYIMNGMEVLFTTSEFEPTDVLGENVYEFILQPNGDLSTDWEGNDTIDVFDSVETIKRGRPEKVKRIYQPEPYVGCGFGSMSCG